MIHRTVALQALLAASVGAHASGCVSIDSDAERLQCYDLALGRAKVQSATPAASAHSANASTRAPAPAAPVASEEKEPGWLSRLKIRDALEGSKKGAAFTAARELSDTTYRIKAAAIYDAGNSFLPEVAQIYNWSWKAGAQLSKDSSPTKPIDGRTLKFGASGNLLAGTPLQLTSFIDMQSVTDRVAKTRDLGLRYSGEFRILDSPILEDGVPYSSNSARFIVPIVGLHLDRHRADGERGRLFGGHVGLGVSYYPGGALYRLHLFGDALRARDFSQSGTAVKRSSTFYDFGVEYAFTDPRLVKDKGLISALSLKRTLGSNFLTGEADTAKTVLTLSMRFN